MTQPSIIAISRISLNKALIAHKLLICQSSIQIIFMKLEQCKSTKKNWYFITMYTCQKF